MFNKSNRIYGNVIIKIIDIFEDISSGCKINDNLIKFRK